MSQLCSYFLSEKKTMCPRRTISALVQPSAYAHSLFLATLFWLAFSLGSTWAFAQSASVPASSQAMFEIGHAERKQLQNELRTPEQVSRVMRRAEAGSTYDQFLIGYAFASGTGEPQDFAEALAWYQRAADRGEPAAMTDDIVP